MPIPASNASGFDENIERLHSRAKPVGASHQLAENEKEGMIHKDSSSIRKDKDDSGVEMNPTLFGQMKDKVAETAHDIKLKGEKLLADLNEKVSSTSMEDVKAELIEKDTSIKKGIKESVRNTGKKIEKEASQLKEGFKNKFTNLLDETDLNIRRFQWADIVIYMIPLLILFAIFSGGLSLYNNYTKPNEGFFTSNDQGFISKYIYPAKPSTMENIKDSAYHYADNVWDALSSGVDYAKDKSNLLLHNNKQEAFFDWLKGAETDVRQTAKTSLWKAKDTAAEQANIAYLEALKKAKEAKKIADIKSKEALSDLKKYLKLKEPTSQNLNIFERLSNRVSEFNDNRLSFMDRIGNKFQEFKDSLVERTGLMGESYKHNMNLAKEEARHRAEELKIKGQNTNAARFGEKIKDTLNDVKDTIKEKIH